MSVQISGIYRIFNKVNGKSYVGSAIDSADRWYEHKRILKHNSHHSPRLQHAVNKYGLENFEFILIEKIKDISKLLEREQYWINYFDAANPEKGYNINKTAGSRLGMHHTEETKERISIKKLGMTPPNKGKPMSSEQKEKLSKAHLGKLSPMKGKHFNYEIRKNMSLAHLGKNLGKEHPFFGKHHTEEAKEKIRKTHIKQFCVHGHNTFIVGRDKQFRCLECNHIRAS
jgi:group I intron endonuclease